MDDKAMPLIIKDEPQYVWKAKELEIKNMNPVTVLIPVGPDPVYLDWLPEAIESVLNQTKVPGEILIVDDGSKLCEGNLLPSHRSLSKYFPFGVSVSLGKQLYNGKWVLEHSGTVEIWLGYWKSPWNIGFAQTFNCGVGVSIYDNIVYLAADDKLKPDCIESFLKTYEDGGRKDAWYAASYEFEDGSIGDIPINAAMVTRNLWKALRGFPPSAFAGPDALLLSCLMKHAPERIVKVRPGEPLYWLRQGAHQETIKQAAFYCKSGVMDIIRNMETERFTFDSEVVLK